MITNDNFYVTGGTLPGDAISYVRRQADELLYRALCQNDYCYILTSRQMGKSSLMVRTATRLKEQGTQTAVVDLTSLGQNVTVEQWYKGILNRVGQGLGIEEQLDDFWYEHAVLPPLERWLNALQTVVLSQTASKVVLFIDEIDMVRSLPFKTDEFFAGIRACYNRRDQHPELSRLTFCLLGVASPSDLIQSSHITPFNIGKRIELYDFTLEEASTLAAGISVTGRDATDLMTRILYWTGGQPYLTQRLCAVVASDTAVTVSADVDRLCSQLFFSRDAQQNEINLAFVRDRILKSGQDLAGLLDLYRRILTAHRHLEYYSVDPLCEVLRLSGIVRVADGQMVVRNRIYQRVFDSAWVRQNMPDAELRRQARAYRRGVLRTLAIASIIVASLGAMLYLTIRSEKRADTALANAQREREIANRQLYTTRMNLAERAYIEGNIERAQQLLQDCSARDFADYRGFEWRYLWGQLHQDLYTFAHPASSFTNQVGTVVNPVGSVKAAGFASNGSLLVTVDLMGSIRQWSLETGQLRRAFVCHYEGLSAAAVARDARRAAIATDQNLLRIYDTADGKEIRTLPESKTVVGAIAFSPDGQMLAAGGLDGTVNLWRIADGKRMHTFAKHKMWINTLAFSADGRLLFSAGKEGGGWMEEVMTGHLPTSLRDKSGEIFTAEFALDGHSLATGDEEGNLVLWNTRNGESIRRRSAHRGSVQALAYSHDGKTLATVGTDTIIKLWDLASGKEILNLMGHKDLVHCIAFSSDSRRVATGSADSTAKIWDITVRKRHLLGTSGSLCLCARFAPDGSTVATANSGNQIVLWDVMTGSPLSRFVGVAPHMEVSADSNYMLRADQQGTITLHNRRNRTALSLRLSKGLVWALALAPLKQEFVAGGNSSDIIAANLETGALLRTLPTRFSAIASLAFSSDGSLLAVQDPNGDLDVINYATAQIVLRLNRPGKKCSVCCFSRNGQELATGFADGTVELRDVRHGQTLWSVAGHVGTVSAIAFSSDGRNIATSSTNQSVHLWNVRTGSEVWTFQEPATSVTGLKFTPDDRSLVSIDRGGAVMIWQAPTMEAISASSP